MRSIHIFVRLFALACVSNALSSVELTKAKKDEEISLGKTYADLDKGLKNLVRENLKSVFRILEERSQEFNLSTQCKGNAFKLLSGLRNLKLWAVNFIDATGKLNDGLLSGNFWMYGNYDQCLNATVLKRNGAVDFRGQYCLVRVGTHLPNPELTPNWVERNILVKNLIQNLSDPTAFFVYKSELFSPQIVTIGLCVPSGCDNNDIHQLIKFVSKQTWLNLTLEYCDTEDTLIYFTPTRIAIICVYSFFIVIVTISSVIEQYCTARAIKFKNPLMRSLLCFSLPHNFQKFKSTKVTEKNLSFLNGVRVLTLFYVILSHHYLLKSGLSIHRNFLSNLFQTWGQRFFFQIIYNGFYTVDVFFFIGGFLNSYLRSKKNLTSFSFSSTLMIFIHRLMRIYPVYIFIILFNLLLNPRGPLAHFIDSTFMETCRKQWWKNILFINNMYDPDYQCIPHSWYLAADTQFFLVSLFTIPLLFRHPKTGTLVHLVIIALSIAYTSIKTWSVNLPPTVGLTKEMSQNVFKDWAKVYFLPFPHASAYFGGVLLGFFLIRKGNLSLSKITLVFGWIIAITMFLSMMFISKLWNSGFQITRLQATMYIPFSRLIYSCSIGWLIFCCFTGRGGFINNILSCKIWIILNRLGLSAFLLSAVIQIYYFANLRTTQDFQHEVEIWGYFGDITITCLLSIPVVLLFESPFIALEKVIFHYEENTPKIKDNEMKGNEIFKQENGKQIDNDEKGIEI